MLAIQIRPMWSDDSAHPGKGFGRWKTYYRAENVGEVAWWIRDVVPSAQMRVLDGREVIVEPVKVAEYRERYGSPRTSAWLDGLNDAIEAAV